jgi:LPS-assembly lipoprotein
MAAALLALPLAACNLRPLHGGPAGAELNRDLAAVEVERLEGRLGQTLRNYLIDELNPAGVSAPPAYTLEIALERAQNALAIQLDDVATRYDLSLAATFELKRKADGKTAYRSAVRRLASYNVRAEPFATLVAERDAERRAAREVARQIRTQLSLHLAKARP